MEYTTLLLEKDGPVLTLTINRPRALNALNRDVFNELEHFFSKGYESHSDLRGVIVTGAGEKAFVAGADITEFAALSKEEGTNLSSRGQGIFDLIENFHLPVIAAINGYALGGGCELAMACHMRIASINSKFGQPEVNLGLIPGYGATQRLVQLIGKSKAMELLLTADMIKAEEARELGLVNHVTEIGEEIEFSKSVISKIATKAPLAIRDTIKCVNAYFDKKINGFEFEYTKFGELIVSKDAKEGAKAFLEKRKANFIGE